MRRRLVFTLILTFVLSIPAFAAITPKTIKNTKANTKVQIKTSEYEGTITEATATKITVTALNKKSINAVVEFNLSKSTKLENCSMKDLIVGAQVKIKHSNAMTKSLPPQTSAISIKLTKAAEKTFSYKGEITAIINGKDGKMVSVIANDNRSSFKEITFVVTRNTNLKGCTMDDLKVGAIIETTYGLVMTRSLPPQTQALSVKLINKAKETFEFVGTIKEVTDSKEFKHVLATAKDSSANNQEIIFVVSKDTKLENCKLEDLKVGTDVKITYGMIMTASLPPQTAALAVEVK